MQDKKSRKPNYDVRDIHPDHRTGLRQTRNTINFTDLRYDDFTGSDRRWNGTPFYQDIKGAF